MPRKRKTYEQLPTCTSDRGHEMLTLRLERGQERNRDVNGHLTRWVCERCFMEACAACVGRDGIKYSTSGTWQVRIDKDGSKSVYSRDLLADIFPKPRRSRPIKFRTAR